MKKYIRERRYVYTAMALATMAALATGVPALADNNSVTPTTTSSAWGRGMQGKGRVRPAVYGTVSAISGDIITVAGKKGFGTNAVNITYTVDATNAKIFKDKMAGTISDIAIGDTIVAQGTLTGTNLVATVVRDGKLNMGMMHGKLGDNPGATFPAITGNGQPIVAGTISAINGSTITITNKSNVTYTIDATSATIHKGPQTATISDLAVGDMVIVQGAVNGSNVTATSVIDQSKPIDNTNANQGNSDQPKPHSNFFGGIGSFFAHLFGF